MTLSHSVYAALFSALALAAPGTAQDVKVDYDHGADFSKYHTFFSGVTQAWKNPLAQERMIAAVDSALTSIGWTKTTSQDSADAIVVLNAATQDKQQLNTFYHGTGYRGWRWGGPTGTATTTATTYTTGTLLVDMFDRSAKKLIWRGVAQGELSNDPEKNTKKGYKVVAKMFKEFPPGRAKK
jgi:hypothetical protein